MRRGTKKNHRVNKRSSFGIQRNGSASSSFLRSLFVYSCVLLSVILIAIACLRYYVIPHYFAVTKSENILVISHDEGYVNADVMYLHLDPIEAKQDVIYLDSEEIVQVSEKYGQYPLKSVYDLISLDDSGGENVTAYFSSIFGVLFDQVITVEREVFEKLASSSQESIFYQSINRFNTHFHGLGEGKILYHINNQLNLQKARGAVEKDASAIKNSGNFGAKFYTQIISPTQSNQCSIAVINTTTSAGLARNVTDLLEHSGFFVVRVDAQTQSDYSAGIIVNEKLKEDCAEIIARLSNVIFPNVDVQVNTDVANNQRAAIVLFLGEMQSEIFTK